ncbi:hypothetical protein [Leifsonia sp. NPDC058230]|uniref:hypothetical protein n=1 Tax=Leifsonia sp. NPDC058230 TaxID=3346391 RepID=UPI0036D8B785
MSITLRRPTDATTEPTEKDTKRPGKGGRGDSAVKAGKPTKAKPQPKTQKAPPKRGASIIVVGDEPRVDLLPPEVRASRRSKGTRRALGYGVLATVLVMVVAVGGGFALNVAAQAKLLVTQSQTVSILAQQQKFMDARTVQNEVATAQAAQQVGASTEIDWSPYLASIQSILPPSVTVQTVNVDSSSPLALYGQSSDPTQKPRVATVAFTAETSTLPDVPAWLRSLEKLPGFADGVAGTITLDQTTNIYTAGVTLHVDQRAFAKRFEPKEK